MSSAEDLFSHWMKLFGEAITGMAGQTATLSARPPADQTESLSNWWGQKLSLGQDELIWLGSSPENSAEIGTIALAGSGLEDPSPEDIVGTFRELVGQALSGLSIEIGRQLKKEVTCAEGKLSANPPANATEGGRTFQVEIGGKTLTPFVVHFSLQLIGLIDLSHTSSAATTPPRPAAAAAPEGRNGIDLLLDVELPVRVSFGKAQLQLRDVLKLTTGSIVELNRSVTEPVDILVNNCVIARGEVVVVDGNYGVRINQIVSRQERLRFVG